MASRFVSLTGKKSTFTEDEDGNLNISKISLTPDSEIYFLEKNLSLLTLDSENKIRRASLKGQTVQGYDSDVSYLTGEIVDFENSLWKATKTTTRHPFGDTNLDSEWVQIAGASSGGSVYNTEFGSVELATDLSTSIGATVLTYNLPSAGTWELTADVRSVIEASQYATFAFYDGTGTVVNNTDFISGAPSSDSQFSTSKSIIVTTVGAETYTLKVISQSATGVTVIGATDVAGSTTGTWKKISGFLPVSSASINNENILINSNFLINQRGAASRTATTSAYNYDRWYYDGSNLIQPVEEGNYVPNTTYTLSGTNVTTQQLTSPASGSWNITVPTNADYVKLERGTVATVYEAPDRATELAKCKRYFQIYGPEMQHGGAYGSIVMTGTAKIVLIFQVEMRSTPSYSSTTPDPANEMHIPYQDIGPIGTAIVKDFNVDTRGLHYASEGIIQAGSSTIGAMFEHRRIWSFDAEITP